MGRNDSKLPLHRKSADVNTRRYVYVMACLVGQTVTVQLSDTSRIQGIFHSGTLGISNGGSPSGSGGDFRIVLRYARELPSGDKVSGEIIDKLIISGHDLVSLTCNDCPMNFEECEITDKQMTGFKTDFEISAGCPAEIERELEKWEPEGEDGAAKENLVTLEEKNVPTWDQFEVNARRFHVKSTYQEDLYTTPLDVTSIPQSIKDKADQIAREIEASQFGTLDPEKLGEGDLDDDEEARFGAVKGTGAYKSDPPVHQVPNSPKNASAEPKKANLAKVETVDERRTKATSSRSNTLPKNINALNLEPAIPKLDEQGRSYFFAKPSSNLGNRIARSPIQITVDRTAQKKNFVASLNEINEKMDRVDWSNKAKAPALVLQTEKRQKPRLPDLGFFLHGAGGSKNFRFNPNADAFTPSIKGSRCTICADGGEHEKCIHEKARGGAPSHTKQGDKGRSIASARGSGLKSGERSDETLDFKPLTDSPKYREPLERLLMLRILPCIVTENPQEMIPAWNQDIPEEHWHQFSYTQILGDVRAPSTSLTTAAVNTAVGNALPEGASLPGASQQFVQNAGKSRPIPHQRPSELTKAERHQISSNAKPMGLVRPKGGQIPFTNRSAQIERQSSANQRNRQEEQVSSLPTSTSSANQNSLQQQAPSQAVLLNPAQQTFPLTTVQAEGRQRYPTGQAVQMPGPTTYHGQPSNAYFLLPRGPLVPPIGFVSDDGSIQQLPQGFPSPLDHNALSLNSDQQVMTSPYPGSHGPYMNLSGNVVLIPPQVFAQQQTQSSETPKAIAQSQPSQQSAPFSTRTPQSVGGSIGDDGSRQQQWVDNSSSMHVGRQGPHSPNRSTPDASGQVMRSVTDGGSMAGGSQGVATATTVNMMQMGQQVVMSGHQLIHNSQFPYQVFHPSQHFGMNGQPRGPLMTQAGFSHQVAFPGQGGIMGIPHQFGYIAQAAQFQQQALGNGMPSSQPQQINYQTPPAVTTTLISNEMLAHNEGMQGRLMPRTPQGREGATPHGSGGYSNHTQSPPQRQMSKHQSKNFNPQGAHDSSGRAHPRIR